MTAITADLRHIMNAQDSFDMSASERDQLYEESTVGPIPVGDTLGTALLTSGIVGRLFAVYARLTSWQGKVFDPVRGELLNKVSPFGIRAIRAKVYVGDSLQVKGQQAIIIDYSTTSFIARQIRDEIRMVAPGLYLGKAFWGPRHVLDFCLSQEPGKDSSI